MNVAQMIAEHRANHAKVTVAALPVRAEEASGRLGVIQVDRDRRIIGFEEKPSDPKRIPGEADYALGSMGNYLFNSRVLCDALDPNVQTIAQKSTAWPLVSRPEDNGGIGFGLKWDMGWMHDTLEYFCQNPINRKYPARPRVGVFRLSMEGRSSQTSGR